MYLNGVRTQNQVYVPIIPSNTEVKETPNSLKKRSLFLKYTNKKTSGVSAALITDAVVHWETSDFCKFSYIVLILKFNALWTPESSLFIKVPKNY